MPKINAKTQELRLEEIKQYVIEGKYANTVLNSEKRGLRLAAKNFTGIGKSLLIT